MESVLYLFHHIHHENKKHIVHHCGGQHKNIDKKLDYSIKHCLCRKHSINRKSAFGHNINIDLNNKLVKIAFSEKCPYGGWHIESGKVI